MKGKYANAAERRRHLEVLEERTATAEREHASADAALASYRKQAEEKIGRLKEQLAAAIADRDAGSSPAIAELEVRNETLRRRIAEMQEDERRTQKIWEVTVLSFGDYLVKVDGLTRAEAHEVIVNLAPGALQPPGVHGAPQRDAPEPVHVGAATLSGQSSRRKTADMELAVGTARGQRRHGDVLVEIFAKLREEPE